MRIAKGLAVLTAAAAVFATGAAIAKEAPNAQGAAKDAVVTTAAPGKTLYVCEDTAMTRRAFARQFGQVEFVTADAVRADGQAWASPKCITSVEARRLKVKRVASVR
jgi:hypothetical protein